MKKKKTKYISGEGIFQIVDVILLSLVALIIIIPVFSVVMTCFVSQSEIARRGSFILIPEKFDFTAFSLMWNSRRNIIRAYGNTMYRVILGTTLQMFMTITFAYGLSRRNLKGRSLITKYVVVTMLFSGGMIPNFLLVKSLGMYNTRLSMIIPGMLSTWNMLVMRNFFMAIPSSLEDAAIIDGASDVQILTKIVLPLSKATIATIALFYAVAHWNAWFDAMIYVNDVAKKPMQNLLRDIISSTSGIGALELDTSIVEETPPSIALQSVVIVITTLPIVCVYPFIQKYFVKGVMVGSIKG